MKVSKRAQAVPPSATMAVTARAKELKAQGVDIISYGAGQPDFDTPDYIKEAAINAIKAGKTKYTATPGILQLRTAIAEKLKTRNNLNYEPSQIIVNIGAKHSIYESMQAVLDPGDEVILPTPYWVTYPEAIKLAGAKPKVVPTTSENDYKITPRQLAEAINDKTVMFLLNSPNNPGGFTYTPDQLKEIAEVLKGTDIMVLSDEIYERLTYEGTKFVSFASISNDTYNRTLTVNGFSKTFAMTGWRIGYTAGPQEPINAMARLQSHMTQNAVAFVQEAAIVALNDPENVVEKMRREFEKRGLHMAQRLNNIEGISCPSPTGAFYCFPNVSAHFGRTINGEKIKNSTDFAKNLLEQAKVALVPGRPFGCDENIRLSFACSLEQIDEGIDRINKWLTR
ncbi:MAG: pyridoxal phosphate-dependent aminotransferase [Planctomycetes bacterium]|nr:pyridoxal phosphate-dependent aminotransferase [Planctomycetota bacterium]